VAPVHTDERDGSIAHLTRDIAEGVSQEDRKLLPAHFAACECELAVADGAEPAHVAVDRHVVRRIGEYEVRPLLPHELRHVGSISRVTAEQAMPSEYPKVVRAADGLPPACGNRILRFIDGVRIRIAGVIQHEVDLGQAETRDLHVEVQVDEALQLDRQDVTIPAGIKGKLVIGKHVRAALGLAEVR
jgi:hypothetical protein